MVRKSLRASRRKQGMVNLTINGKAVTVPYGSTLLDAAVRNNIHIPNLCYLKDLNEIGACRVCIVEVEGYERLVPACHNTAEEGMVVFTNSPKVRETRRINVELLLSQHDCHCATCVRSGNCSLQKISNDLGILNIPYTKKVPQKRWPKDFPLIRDTGKCIKCMRCIQVCDKVQSLGVWDLAGTGSRTDVDVSRNRSIKDAGCALCGQCITHCPVGALRERDDTQKAFAALADPELITVVQVAPAVRAAWGEGLGLSDTDATIGRMVASLKKIGFNYVFDTCFTADLTIMEEGSELIARLNDRENNAFPMFTSCCPGWVRFIKSQYPDMTKNLSTAKSPQQMFGAVAKTYYAKLLNVAPEKIFCVSIMPCTAKKHECDIPVMNDAGTDKDVDLVLTTRELTRMIRAEHIVAAELADMDFDKPLGTGTGAGVIFGATGGVMEAALRSAYYLVTGENPGPDAFCDVRGMDGWREASFDIADTTLRVAVASGLSNARRLIEAVKDGSAHYDFVEIMACPGGCAGGGGQPIHDGLELASSRSDTLYQLDVGAKIRFSHENPAVTALYKDELESPLSEKSHHLLHTDHFAWEITNK